MDYAPIVNALSALPAEAIREMLAHALIILSHRGSATNEQTHILVEMQYMEQPHLRELRVA